MTEYDLIDGMRRYFEEEIEATTLAMKRGMYQDHAAYREAVGRIGSLELSLQRLGELEEQMMEQ